MRKLLLASAILLGGLGAAQAQEALYGPQPPKGSAYVRIVNATDAKADVKPAFRAPLSLGTGTADRVSDYQVVEAVAGKKLALSVTVGGKMVSGTADAESDGFLTVLVLPDPAGAKIVGINDDAEFNQIKTRLAFYNAIPGCASGVLALDPGGQAVFKDVDPGDQKTRSVNPTTASVKASCGDKSADPIALSGLEQGGMNSVFLVSSAGKPTAFVVKDVATPYKK